MPAATVTVEDREFRAHQSLITDVIMRQAGTLSKAIAEGVQNAVDASASTLVIQLSSHTLTLSDNGKGFESADSIKEVFEVFGQPHERDANGISTDAKYGTFRIGRGQLFAFGVNTWRTNTFEMRADVKGDGLKYKLTSGLKPVRGCTVTVELYDALSLGDIGRVRDEVTKLCKYVGLSCVMNGVEISKDFTKEKWDYSDATMCVSAKASTHRYSDTVLVYNQGVFVESISSYDLGFSGTVLVHDKMVLNFARNQVIRSCKVWKRVVIKAQELACVLATKKRMTKSEAGGVASQYLRGDASYEKVREIKCWAEVNGRFFSLKDLERDAKWLLGRGESSHNSLWRVSRAVTVASPGSRAGDLVIQLQRGRVIDRSSLFAIDRRNQSAKDLVAAFLCKVEIDSGVNLSLFEPYESPEAILGPNFDMDARIIDEKKVKPSEQLILDAVRSSVRSMRSSDRAERKLLIGDSLVNEGWTDGSSYIAVSRHFLKGLRFDMETGWHELMNLLCHEYAHDSPDSATHDHTFDFYFDYHELTRKAPSMARQAFLNYWSMSKKRAVKSGKNLDAAKTRELHRRAEAYVAHAMITENENEPTGAEKRTDQKAETDEGVDNQGRGAEDSGRRPKRGGKSPKGVRRDILP